MIPAVPVESSNLNAIGYHQGDLYVRFKNGLCYAYRGVPLALYYSLKDAESVGQFFHQNIRTAFPYEKLAADPFAADAGVKEVA